MLLGLPGWVVGVPTLAIAAMQPSLVGWGAPQALFLLLCLLDALLLPAGLVRMIRTRPFGIPLSMLVGVVAAGYALFWFLLLRDGILI